MKYRVKLTCEVEYEAPDGQPIEEPQFYFEEHICVNDLLDQISIDVEDGKCLDFMFTKEYLGEVK